MPPIDPGSRRRRRRGCGCCRSSGGLGSRDVVATKYSLVMVVVVVDRRARGVVDGCLDLRHNSSSSSSCADLVIFDSVALLIGVFLSIWARSGWICIAD